MLIKIPFINLNTKTNLWWIYNQNEWVSESAREWLVFDGKKHSNAFNFAKSEHTHTIIKKNIMFSGKNKHQRIREEKTRESNTKKNVKMKILMKMNNVIFQYKHHYNIFPSSLLLLLSYQHQSTFSFISTLILSRETFLPLHSDVRLYFNARDNIFLKIFRIPSSCLLSFYFRYTFIPFETKNFPTQHDTTYTVRHVPDK